VENIHTQLKIKTRLMLVQAKQIKLSQNPSHQ